MPTTPKGVFYPDSSWTFPPGLSGSSGAFQTMAESVDTAIQSAGMSIIASGKLAAPSNLFTFSSIPQNYSDLVIVWGGDSDISGAYGPLTIRMNGDATAGNYYSGARGLHIGSTANVQLYPTGGVFTGQGSLRCGFVGSDKSGGWIHLPQYAGTTQQKIAYSWGVAQKSGGNLATSPENQMPFQGVGRWLSTSAVTSVRIWPDAQLFEIGTTFALFGVPII